LEDARANAQTIAGGSVARGLGTLMSNAAMEAQKDIAFSTDLDRN
jgi:hypothetical protein